MRFPIRCLLSYFLFWLLLLNPGLAQSRISWKNVSILVYTKNGKGYVHDNIPSAVAAMQKLAQQRGFKINVSDKPEVFTTENLKKYTLLLFPSTNNDVFDTDEQRLAFRKYMQAGGGFVGLHSVIGTERNWPWFKMMLGGSFVWHPPFQKLKIILIDPSQPSAQGLPKVWEKEDECYLMKDLYPGTHTFLAHDLNNLNPSEGEKIKSVAGPYTSLYPAAWYQKFDGGNIWITALGHAKTDYQDPLYLRHIWQGIEYVAGQVHKLDYAKAYATQHDEAVRY
ncbi:ThuA domain-containing protein [Adhaeribacter arboris]|uniref:ThuA domain-containing protein n=1 Tax=Adhaeribacter arboris TaxID=2072846 RepID=A0A2T2YAP4_9BACT|nr:ThuA domain-containing protein [Adhaeribacter arboris]PSR52556.1 ThuA domain-containing protein [Adhaeribacter arboris]